jgi:hypothetical protein
MRPFADKLPDWAKDAMFSSIDIHFGFIDRLKILFGWRVTLDVSTATQEEIIGKLETRSEVRVWRLPIFRKPVMGYAESPPEK